jgi:LmbE family N-acetylglucosaminyl deacetylase
MLKRKFLIIFLLVLLAGCARTRHPGSAVWPEIPALEPFNEGERVLILAPHPDDETIACAGVIQQALGAGAKVRVVYLTNGDHNELAFIVYEKRLTVRSNEFVHMGNVRRQEAIKAMQFLGLSEGDLVFLGYPDFGTFNIFSQYWQVKKPFRDRLTRISSVPYKDSPSYGAVYCGESILKDLKEQILDYRPDKIFVSHPADVNVDHKSLYLFLQVALSDLDGRIAAPRVYPYLVHCVGWPKPRHYHPEMELYPPDKFIDSQINWKRLDLGFDELDRKYRATLFYRSQTESSAFYLLAFSRENELFGDYPVLELSPQQADRDQNLVFSGFSKMFEDAAPSETPRQEEAPGISGRVSYAEEDGYLVVKIDKIKKFSRRFGVLLYVFGYSRDKDFASMPKIRIITAAHKCRVFNAQKRVVDSGVALEFGRGFLILKIPLELLGEPDYVLTALKAFHGSLPVDAVGFRKVRIRR